MGNLRDMRPLVKVTTNELAISAFRKIKEERVTGVAVVNHARQIVGVISASDLRMIGPDASNIMLLYMNCDEFIKHAQATNMNIVQRVVSVTPVDTMGTVIEKMVDNDIHRVFVVRTHHGMEQEVVVGVISLRDVLVEFIA